MDRHISAPVGRETAEELRAGDYVYITGTIYTARDAAHKRMYETLREGGDLPINIEGQAIYYMGPSPAREGRPIGSAGPTTASRIIGSRNGGNDWKGKKKSRSDRCCCSQ